MTREALLHHWQVRRQQASKILQHPNLFKVCEQCRCIFSRQAAVCSLCGAYRFDSESATVLRTVRLLGRVPFPYTAAVAPRDTVLQHQQHVLFQNPYTNSKR